MKQKHTKYTQINLNKSMHSEMGPVWQNPIQRTVITPQHRTVLLPPDKHHSSDVVYWRRGGTKPNSQQSIEYDTETSSKTNTPALVKKQMWKHRDK